MLSTLIAMALAVSALFALALLLEAEDEAEGKGVGGANDGCAELGAVVVVGLTVALAVGEHVGLLLFIVGASVGKCEEGRKVEGASEGAFELLGSIVGAVVGKRLGLFVVGASVLLLVGATEGERLGRGVAVGASEEGDALLGEQEEGPFVGLALLLGAKVDIGATLGLVVGNFVGLKTEEAPNNAA